MRKRVPCFPFLAVLPLALWLGGCRPVSRATSPSLEATVQVVLTQVSAQSTQLADHLTYISYLATRVPAFATTAVNDPQRDQSVQGSLMIEGGRCCVGGIAGQPVRIQVALQAISSAAEIAEMRLRPGLIPLNEVDLSNTEWEPYALFREFEYVPPLNWSGFYIAVQFRDALGNLSPVYSDGVSVEGMHPPPPSATP